MNKPKKRYTKPMSMTADHFLTLMIEEQQNRTGQSYVPIPMKWEEMHSVLDGMYLIVSLLDAIGLLKYRDYIEHVDGCLHVTPAGVEHYHQLQKQRGA